MNSFFNFDTYPPVDFSFPIFDDPEPADDDFAHEEYHQEIFQDGRKSHLCTFPDCGKIFKFKSEITRHLVIHFNQRPYVCAVEGCNKAFKRADALENHTRTHTQDLQYRCDYPGCDMKFVTKSALKYHLLKHDNQKAFVCEFAGCGKSFLTKAQLKQHEKAENYHRKVAVIQQVAAMDHPEPVKKVKTMSVVSKDPFTTLMATPAPRMAKSLAWETKNPEEMDEPISNVPMSVNVSESGDIADMLKRVLEENKALKEKLEICTRMMDVFQENQKLKEQLTTKMDPDFQFEFQPKEVDTISYPLGGSEFSFLNF